MSNPLFTYVARDGDYAYIINSTTYNAIIINYTTLNISYHKKSEYNFILTKDNSRQCYGVLGIITIMSYKFL